MTRKISIANQKGGCGKTATGINLAAALAELPVYKGPIRKLVTEEKAEDLLQKTKVLWKWLNQKIH